MIILEFDFIHYNVLLYKKKTFTIKHFDIVVLITPSLTLK